MKIKHIYTKEIGEVVDTYKQNNKEIYTVKLESGAYATWYKEQTKEGQDGAMQRYK